MRLGEPVMQPEPALMRFGTPLMRFGMPLMRFGEALMWPGEALMCAPSAFPDGFYVVLADWGQNSGRPWSKRDSWRPATCRRDAPKGLRPPAQGCRAGRG